jgi:hypothetical protein
MLVLPLISVPDSRSTIATIFILAADGSRHFLE